MTTAKSDPSSAGQSPSEEGSSPGAPENAATPGDASAAERDLPRAAARAARPPARGTRAARREAALQATVDADTGQPDIGLLRQIWRFRDYGRRQIRSLLLGVLMRVGELAADLAAPWPLALVIDNVLKGRRPEGGIGQLTLLFGPTQIGMLGVAAVAVLVITAASGGFDYLGDWIMNSAGERITSEIRSDVFAHLQRLPMRYHDRQPVGELTSRIASDTARIEDSLVGMFSTLLPGIFSLCGFAAVLLTVNWRLGLVAMCAAPLVFATAARYTRLTRKSARRRRAAEGKLSGFVAESLQGIRTIHAFGRQDLHDDRFGASNDVVLQTGLTAVELRARFTPLLEAVTAVGTAALLFVGGYGVLHGWWTVGVLVVVTSYLKDMLKPMRALSKLAMTFTQGAASAERVAAIFAQTRPAEDPDADLPRRVAGAIELRDVGLDYGRGPVLHQLTMRINPGERIALIGHNGAGKSSVLSLISGLYPPTRGQVLLDGVPMDSLPDWWLHQQVSVVLQDTFLFSGTLADNIRYGRPEATDEEVGRAADEALVTQFSNDLPDGLETELADGGVGLSGGQRQRVGIARALLLGAPVVLLDEPTTGLDVAAEELVVRALTRLAQGRTVVMTTHRPALTRLATRTVYLQNGSVASPPPRPGGPGGPAGGPPGGPPGGSRRWAPPPPNGYPAPPNGFPRPRVTPAGRIGSFAEGSGRPRPTGPRPPQPPPGAPRPPADDRRGPPGGGQPPRQQAPRR
ncbi:MAG TPA: ABC transporter ATP-binding protein [Pseudonocardia sp.]|jgi:ABC-type multidrug transport system fused ATPase/permease subunit